MSRLLVVEDEEIVAAFLETTLTSHGHEVVVACDAEAAYALLERDREFEALLLDRCLPGMDGIALLQRIKSDPRLGDIPVVMETALGDAESVREGIAAGAQYYLTKPLQPPLLLAVVDAAVEQYRETRQIQALLHDTGQALTLLQSGAFTCRSLSEARELARGLARACPEPSRAVIGLQELLVNAVEHGNLAISYAEKTRLVVAETWAEEVEARLVDPRYRDRRVAVRMERLADHIEITIEDEGEGFDWQQYLEFSADRAFDPHGRGIAMARLSSLDEIEYQGCGNRVVAKILLGQ